MTADQFTRWLSDMKLAELAKSDAECGRLLGKSPDTIVRMKQYGTDLTVALACNALLHGMRPYS